MENKREYKLAGGLVCAVDAMTPELWNDNLAKFSDASYSQTWQWNSEMSRRVSTLVIFEEGSVIAAAILRILTIPVLRTGFAYLGSGPMWQLRDKEPDLNVLRLMLNALRDEYARSRGLLLQIAPYIYENDENYNQIVSLIQEEKFCLKNSVSRTLILDLLPSESELRRNLHSKWRYHLSYSERQGFRISEGTDSKQMLVFRELYKEMLHRKQYENQVNIRTVERIQSSLPEHLKFRIFICSLEGVPMSGTVMFITGRKGYYYLGATGDQATKNKASYFMHWSIVKWMKAHGVMSYDLGGCNPEKVPGTYRFKAGLCGKDPVLYHRIGIIEASGNRAVKVLFNMLNSVRLLLKR